MEMRGKQVSYRNGKPAGKKICGTAINKAREYINAAHL